MSMDSTASFLTGSGAATFSFSLVFLVSVGFWGCLKVFASWLDVTLWLRVFLISPSADLCRLDVPKKK